MRLDPTPLLRPMIESKRLEAPLLASALAGNIDRRTDLQRDHWRVQDAAGRVVKVTVGANLNGIRAIADQFHALLPEISPGSVAFFQADGRDVWVQEWVGGTSLEQPVSDVARALEAIQTLETLSRALAMTEQLSTPQACEGEFTVWSSAILELPVWTPPEKTFLHRTLLPALSRALSATPSIRWTNGDFTAGNIRQRGKCPVLLDFEHGKRTHFHHEDHLRFLRLSTVAHQHPALFAGIWPGITPAWEAFFQLRQLALELAVNTPKYLLRVIPERKANLRSAFQASGLDEPAWSTAPRPAPPEFAQETVQLFWKIGEAWTEADSRRVEIRRGERQFVTFRLPVDPIKFLRLDPTATARPSVIHALRVVDLPGNNQDVLPTVSVAGAKSQPTPEGLRIFPEASDPQLWFSLGAPGKFVVAEITVLER